MVRRLIGPNSVTMTELGRESGIPMSTLSRWRHGAASIRMVPKKEDILEPLVPTDPKAKRPQDWSALERAQFVLEAAAVGIPDANYGQEIMACVVLKPGAHCTLDELNAFSLNELGKYKTPKIIRFVNDLPKGPSGKVQRLKLLEP